MANKIRKPAEDLTLEGSGGGAGGGGYGGGAGRSGGGGGGISIGRRMSDRELTQTGSKNSRAVTKEGLTNKNDSLPSLRADVMKDQASDIRIMMDKGKKPTTSELTAATREAAKERAMARTGGRAAAVVGSAGFGVGVGSIYNTVTGEDKKPSSRQSALEENNKEKFSTDKRVNKEDYPIYKKETKSADSFREEFKKAKEDNKNSFSFEGRKYNTDVKPNLAKGGVIVNKGIGASMKPHNVFGSKGKK